MKYYSAGQITKNEMDGGMEDGWGMAELHTVFCWESLRVGDHLGDLGVDGTVILKWIFNKRYREELT
jgi:hypothetical protein